MKCRDLQGPHPVFAKEVHRSHSEVEIPEIIHLQLESNDRFLQTEPLPFSMTARWKRWTKRASSAIKDSSLVSILCLRKPRKEQNKYIYLFQYFILPHSIAFGLTFFRIFLQNYESTFCWKRPICSCVNFQSKVYSILSLIIFDYALLLLAIYYFSVEVNFSKSQRMFCFLGYYFPCILLTFAYIVSQIENDTFDETPLFLMYVFLSFLFNLNKLKTYNFELKRFSSHLFNIFFVILCIFLHYTLVQKVFPFLNTNLFADLKFRDYFVPGYQFIYFRVISIIFNWSLQVYHRYIYTLNEEIIKENNNNECLIAIRLIMLFNLSIPLGNLLTLEQHIFGWFFLFSYINFLISTFTRNDIILRVYLAVIRFLCRKPNLLNSIDDNISKECSLLISGNLLDFMFIINSRLLSWVLMEKWICFPVQINYYQDCNFTISHDFLNIVQGTGIWIILGVNMFITFGIFAYMKWKKEKLFEYKMPRKKIFNVLYLLFLHKLFDQSIQMIYYIR